MDQLRSALLREALVAYRDRLFALHLHAHYAIALLEGKNADDDWPHTRNHVARVVEGVAALAAGLQTLDELLAPPSQAPVGRSEGESTTGERSEHPSGR